LFNNTFPFPFTVSLPPLLRFPLPVLSHLPFPLPTHCSLPFPGPILTAACVLPTLAVVIDIAIARRAPSTTRCSGICPVLIIIILVDYLIRIQWSNNQEVTWLVLPGAWRLNLSPEIIATLQREKLAGVFNLPWAGCLWIGAIDLVPEGTGVVPPPIVHLVTAFVNHLPQIWADGSPPLPKRRTRAPVVWPHELDVWKAASRDWIKKDYIIKEFPCPLILDTANIEYPYQSTDVFQDESLYTVPIQQQVYIDTQCRYYNPSSCLHLSFAAAFWYHRYELKMNLHPRHWHYDTVECSRRKARGNVQSCVGYGVCSGTRGVVLWKSREVEIVQDAGGVFDTGGKENGSLGGKKRYIYSSSCDFLVQLVRYDDFDSYPAFCWLMNIKRPSLHLAQPPGTSWMGSLKTRFSTHGEVSLKCPALLLQCIPPLPLRSCTSPSKFSSSQVVPTLQPSNTATNMPSGGKSTCNWCHRIANTSLFALQCF